MGPIGKESSFSTVISSLHVVSANARRNTSSGLMFPCTVSPDRHFSFVLVCPSFTLPSFDKTLTVLIRDGMGIIQSLDVKKFSNFGDLSIFYLKHLSMLFQSAETIVAWNREVGMGPIGKESSFSTVTLSLHVVSANALRNISSGLKSPCTVSNQSIRVML
jgi:hypothetical protein